MYALLALLAPAGDEQQRVVDRHPEADEGDQELHEEGDVGDVGEAQDDEQGREDRDRGDQQRHEGQQRGEDERENRERAERADHRLDEHPGSALDSCRLRLQQPGQARPRGPGGRAARQRPLGPRGNLRRPERPLEGGEQQRIGGTSIVCDQVVVSRDRNVSYAGIGHGCAGALERARQPGRVAADVCPAGTVTTATAGGMIPRCRRVRTIFFAVS